MSQPAFNREKVQQFLALSRQVGLNAMSGEYLDSCLAEIDRLTEENADLRGQIEFMRRHLESMGNLCECLVCHRVICNEEAMYDSQDVAYCAKCWGDLEGEQAKA